MPVVLDPQNTDNHVVEESTAIINISFRDRNGQGVTPDSALWTLTDADGTVINSKEDVAIGSLATNVNVVISGDDLAISSGFTGDSETRIFTIEAIYDSDLENNLPLKESLTFYVDNLVAVP